jgi:transposase
VVEGIVFRYRTGVAWRDLSGALLPGRNITERPFNGFEHWRGPATRDDKHAIVYRAGLVLAAVLLWLTHLR